MSSEYTFYYKIIASKIEWLAGQQQELDFDMYVIMILTIQNELTVILMIKII